MLDFINKILSFICGEKMKRNKYISKQIPILEEQLKSFLKESKKEEGIVISLQGSWGIGKTFFWKNFAERTWNENQQVYISLFGKHSLEDIKKQIVLKVYDKNKIANFVDNNPLIGKFIEHKWGIDASLIANTFTKDTFKGIVLCFDDFERISSNLSIYEILGYISELKEEHKCKIVIINNNDSLKEQDNLNHKKILKKKITEKNEDTAIKELSGIKVDDYKVIEKFFISQTNNQEIFDRFSEKLIDYRLYYEPHYSDVLDIVKNDSLSFVNWEFIEELLSTVSDTNKQCNIRLIKQLISKLELLNSSIDSSTINEKISNSLIYEVFISIFDESKLQVNSFSFTDINSLLDILDDVLKKHYLDKEKFSLVLAQLNNELGSNEYEREVYIKAHNIYDKFLYDLNYDDKNFVNDFYNLFEDNKKNIVRILGLNSFKGYIEIIRKIDDNEKYKKLYEEAIKKYIDYMLEINGDTPDFQLNQDRLIVEKNEELKKYFEEKKNEIVIDRQKDLDIIIKVMISSKENGGYNLDDEQLLNSISKEQHKKWFFESADYLKVSFNFIRWVNGFTGTKPFEIVYINFIEAIKELSKDKKYENKLSLMVDFFEKNK